MAKNQRYQDVPLSESTGAAGASADPRSKEECIAELRRIAEIDTDKVITRNYFRTHSRYKESVWNTHFGTFEEFKRAAAIILSRHQHRLEKHIAKHASVEVMREMNLIKSEYEGKYLRPNAKRFQTMVHVTDIHDKEADPFAMRVFYDTLTRVRPEKVIIGGDLFDLPEFGKYGVDPREWDVVGRIRAALGIVGEIRTRCPDAELVLVEGNHEYRLLRHLAEATPALRTVLSDLHHFTVPKLLGLDEFEINYVSRTDLGTFTERDIKSELNRNYHIAYDCYLSHHFPEGERMAMPGAHGHHHRHEVRQHFNPTFGAYEWMQLGCMHRRQASYCAGEKWGLGFAIIHIDTHAKHVLHEYAQIRDFAMVGGKFYERGTTEN